MCKLSEQNTKKKFTVATCQKLVHNKINQNNDYKFGIFKDEFFFFANFVLKIYTKR
jgi:hypothetical protein